MGPGVTDEMRLSQRSSAMGLRRVYHLGPEVSGEGECCGEEAKISKVGCHALVKS